ncbi:hypothetical protein EPA93_10145 [Ktedonosporobacter rubrisoli]|uniref:Uncharacterized protein n=1 Tax=Ktedonosporobacter rubrisoli TaxID=2509675 RepID=A0A4P6JM78_KTERU|nr:DUF6022 family protein [Ktedonosporobacter rubrisoli]QBD76348.1 hypothetical protein EPA93_10145 [Ktedonosporobacter rubrisoli]
MPNTLATELENSGRTVEVIAAYVQHYVNERYQQAWQEMLPELEQTYATKGEPAYGLYCIRFFQPLKEELEQVGLQAEQNLPGNFPSSIEEWGPRDYRERRFWTVLRESNGEKLGTLVTRIFHDHTKLRLPQAPAVLPLSQTDDEAIKQFVMQID